jgi:hypothetical protein
MTHHEPDPLAHTHRIAHNHKPSLAQRHAYCRYMTQTQQDSRTTELVAPAELAAKPTSMSTSPEANVTEYSSKCHNRIADMLHIHKHKYA